VIASFLGGWIPSVVRLTHERMQLVISFVGGLMLGVGVFHLLPHSINELQSVDRSVWWMMVGLLGMFFLIRTFHFHQHDAHVEECEGEPHDHHHEAHAHVHELGWAGVAFGLGVHTLIDGLALAASVHAEADHVATASLMGLGTFLAVVLHKPLDAISITSLMTAGGWSSRSRNLVNFGFALMCPTGALLFVLGVHQMGELQHVIIGCALAFSAGVFLCISLSDLLPELEFHTHDRLKLSTSLVLGVLLAFAIGFLEPDHIHDHHSENHAEESTGSQPLDQVHPHEK